MTIIRKSNREFEYIINNNTYKFSKSEDENENETNGDKFKEYQVILIFQHGSNKPRSFIKRYIDKIERDDFFNNLKETEIDDFTDWEEY